MRYIPISEFKKKWLEMNKSVEKILEEDKKEKEKQTK
jgi:hypothetical protein